MRSQASVTIDDIVESLKLEPTFIKIDVEGAEHHVLKGASNTLQKYHPKILLEIHPSFLPEDISADNVQSILFDRGYKMTIVNQDNHSLRTLWVY
jgi:hypothetical protein